jgi:hypothetical protein
LLEANRADICSQTANIRGRAVISAPKRQLAVANRVVVSAQTAIMSSRDDVSSPKLQLSAAKLLPMTPNNNYQQQSCRQ